MITAFEAGDRVQIKDRDRQVNRYPFATVVRAESRSGPGGSRDGYVIRYDNGSEGWVREYDVMEPTDVTDPAPSGVDATAWRGTRHLAPDQLQSVLDAVVAARRADQR